MAKNIEVTDQGYVWSIPASVIANDRAKYYAEHDSDTTYQEEFDYTMGDDYELRDWFLNDMNWVDVEDSAVLVETPHKVEPDLFLREVQASVKVVVSDE